MFQPEYSLKGTVIFVFRQENHKLRDQNDDLNAQILSLSLYEEKSLFSCHSKVQCLAAEIDNASRDEVCLRSSFMGFPLILFFMKTLFSFSVGRRFESTGGEQPAFEEIHGQNNFGHS